MTEQKPRCEWVSSDPLLRDYHDNEWGKPQYDSRILFEFICLEALQAGLSWITVLKKRAEYQRQFFHFDPDKMSTITDITPFMNNAGLIRNRLKMQALITNAKAYIAMRDNGEDFSTFIWSFAGGKPIVKRDAAHHAVIVSSPESDKMAKALKKKGFTFVGTITCYAYMQATGMVNDHTFSCFCHPSRASSL